MSDNNNEKMPLPDNPPPYTAGSPGHMPPPPQPGMYPPVSGQFDGNAPPQNFGQPQPTGPGIAPGTTAPGQPGTHTVVIAQHPSYRLRDNPVNLMCPHCHEDVLTRIETSPGLMAWLICLGIMASALLVGVTLLCCWIPFCIPACNDVSHSCPKCGQFIGKFKRMGA